MKLSEFDYNLPKDLIAQYPAPERDSSRMLVIHKDSGVIRHRRFRDIIDYLRPGDIMVLNDTKVVPARLHARKPTGGKAEILLLKELGPDIWEALVKGLTAGTLTLARGITASVSRSNGVARVKFSAGQYDVKKALYEIGIMPLPPYIKRKAGPSDAERYQTVYAKNSGAVAAPTAGLHFTDSLLDSIRARQVKICMMTLQVGPGTFRPVEADDIRDHHMDEEIYEIPGPTADAVNSARSEGRRIIAVGTTVTRALEASAARTAENTVMAGKGKTSVFICPGYRFRVIDALMTNFHLPRSTPMMLASAFSGLKLLKTAYSEASGLGYRFYSYGDSMLITGDF